MSENENKSVAKNLALALIAGMTVIGLAVLALLGSKGL